jgi:hypothetical protein
MPNYASLSSQIDAVKAEITTSIGAATYTAQDLIFVSAALKNLGEMLGVNDVVAATADGQAQINTLVTNILNGTAPATAGELYVGDAPVTWSTSAALTNPVAVLRYDSGTSDSSYAQIAFNNDDPTSSTDIIVYTSNGTDASGWTGMGMTGNSFDDATYGITGPQDGYIFTSAKAPLIKSISQKGINNNVATITTSTAHGFTVGKKVNITGVDATFNGTYTIATTPTTTSFTYAKTASNVTTVAATGSATMYFGAGNLVLATSDTGSENKIIIAAGGYATGDTQIAITPGENVHVEIPTASVSPSTGAVTVVGGVGINGDLNIAGDVNINGTISFAGGGTTVVSENLAVTDPAIFVADNNTGNLVDFTFIGEYVVGGNTKYSAFSKDATDGVWKLTSGISTAPTTTINYSEAGVVFDKLQLAQVVVTTAPTAANEVTTKSYVDTRAQNEFVLGLMGAI